MTQTDVMRGTDASRDVRREEDLVAAHLPLVGYLVNEMIVRLPSHVSRDDLTSAGLMALAQAARSFDESRGVPFNRFASTRIRGALIDELRSYDWASRSVRARARQRDRAEEDLAIQLGRTPTPAEVAAYLGVAESELQAVDGDVARAVVLSLHGFADLDAVDQHVSSHVSGPEDVLLHRERVGYLQDAVTALPERLRAVVQGYFFEERPMAEIAAELGVTESRISQMRAEAMVLLRDGINAQLDPDMVPPPERAGVAARRREAYFAAVAAQGTFRARISARPAVEGVA